MRYEHGGKVEAAEHTHEEQHQRNARYDIGVQKRYAVDAHYCGLTALSHIENAHARESADRRCYQRREQGEQKSVAQSLHDRPAREQILIPSEGKAAPLHIAGIIEGHDR